MPRMEAITGTDTWKKECGRCRHIYEITAKTWKDAQQAFLKHFEWASISAHTYDELHSYCCECKQDWKHGRDFGIKRRESLIAQDGKCGICCKEISFDDRTANVDHDHKTGKHRKVLCRLCNVWMAAIDNDEWLEKAIAYRDAHRG